MAASRGTCPEGYFVAKAKREEARALVLPGTKKISGKSAVDNLQTPEQGANYNGLKTRKSR
eukprot:scaffold49897_cov32-Tisochrysis_lutea.AAC.5